jgi:hypothetical protein
MAVIFSANVEGGKANWELIRMDVLFSIPEQI